MAIYNFKCVACENVFRVNATIQENEMGESEKFICPKCKSKNTKQEFSATNFVKNIFKSSNETGSCCSAGACCDSENASKNKKNDCCGGDNKTDCCS